MSYAIAKLKKKRIFDHITVNRLEDELQLVIPAFKEKRQKKIAYQINKIMKKNKVSNLVLSNDLKQFTDFKNILLQNSNSIITGKKLYKVLLPKIITELSKLLSFEKEKMNIAILVQEYSADNVELIQILADEVKSLSIVTNNGYRFEQIVSELLRSKGIAVQLLQKGKTNLKRRHIIINLDFSSSELETLNVPNESIVITNQIEKQKMKNGFNGIVIRDIDIYLGQRIEDFRSMELCEAYIYRYMKRIKENTLLFNRSIYQINGYIGNNGKIEQEDFERLGKKFKHKS